MNVRRRNTCRTTLPKTVRAYWQSGEARWCLRMSRNLVVVRLGRADKFLLMRMRGGDLAITEHKFFTAPVNLVAGKAGKPYPESDEIAQRQQQERAPERLIMHHADANLNRHGGAQRSGCGQ